MMNDKDFGLQREKNWGQRKKENNLSSLFTRICQWSTEAFFLHSGHCCGFRGKDDDDDNADVDDHSDNHDDDDDDNDDDDDDDDDNVRNSQFSEHAQAQKYNSVMQCQHEIRLVMDYNALVISNVFSTSII